MPLKLSLKPQEKFVVNGAVLQNGDRRGILLLQNKASVLREKDIMQPEDANTPAKRIYFPVMMMYLDGGAPGGSNYDQFVLRTTEFMNAITNSDMLKECVALSRDVMGGDYYRALGRCRKLIAYENEVFGNVDSGVSAGSETDRKSA
ncbi:MAG: flagellar biosynthesis repressor FlbT [Hirschia sp.]|nr:flagellar biosynthesis repressor FlbT [Hirschia sp.]MBF17665.1 flagellar biosynthesis repressor FlbT [Hirschia sp.]|tara:strand:- start:102 stop:542 length:441 start_codon:yes stop_codon:yes gene_type:complete